MANFLKIIQDAADEIGIAQPASGVGNSNVESLKLVRYADKVGNAVMKSFHWQILTKEKTFTFSTVELAWCKDHHFFWLPSPPIYHIHFSH